MNCPRCDAPVKGDYKYCPECACRLRIQAPAPEPETRSAPLGGVLLGLVAAALLGAGIFVGYQVLGDRKITIGPPSASRQILTVADIPENLASVPDGVAFWEPETVWEAPPEDEVDARLLRTFHRGEVSEYVDKLLGEPQHLTRWSGLLRLLHARTRDIMIEKTQHVPIRTRAFRMMRYEVTRGQWAEFLRAVEADPALLLRLFPNLRELWRPKGRPTWAVYYRADWWRAVHDHIDHRQRRLAMDLLPPPPPEDEEPLSKSEDDVPADPDAAANPDDPASTDDPANPDAPDDFEFDLPEIPVPAFIEAERLDTITDAEAVKLLYPASWVRIDESGALYWVLEPGTENLPVTDISWWDAQLFVVWARQKLGLPTLRVPSWAEWVRAFHGNHPEKRVDDYDEEGDPGWRWPWGNADDAHGCNNLNHTWNKPVPMMRDVRRAYGWHDGDTVDGILSMAGNAAEWTRGSVYQESASGENYILPDDPAEGDTNRALVYGGSYLDGLDDCSVKGGVALRKTERRIDVGFRLVLDQSSLASRQRN